jgi:hypothetical protein
MVHVMLDKVIIVIEGWARHPGATTTTTTTTTTLMIEMWRMVVLQGRSDVLEWQWLSRSCAVEARVRPRAGYQGSAATAGTVSQKVKAAVPVINVGTRVMVQCRTPCATVSVIIWKRNA